MAPELQRIIEQQQNKMKDMAMKYENTIDEMKRTFQSDMNRKLAEMRIQVEDEHQNDILNDRRIQDRIFYIIIIIIFYLLYIRKIKITNRRL